MRRGFTLIELLVVIAIIAILAALLFPVFIAAKEKGRQANCLNNMGQLARAFRMYIDDFARYPGQSHLEEFSMRGSPAQNPNGAWIWFNGYWRGSPTPPEKYPYTWAMAPEKGAIWRYTRNRQLYVCPSDANARKITYKNTRTGVEYPFGLSYAYNEGLAMCPPPTGPNRATDGDVRYSSKTVLLVCEGAGYYSEFPEFQCVVPCLDGTFRYWQCSPTVVHTGGCNFSFCDGHAKWMPHDKFSTLVYRVDGVISPRGHY